MGIRCEARLGLIERRALRRAVFFDRDGVLNEAVVRDRKPFPPTSVAEVRFSSGARDAVIELRAAGFATVCVTNQPDVARGTLDRDVAESINRYVAESLGLDDFVACYHDDRDDCPCRKPKPGMIFDAASRLSLDVTRSYLVGDRWKDIEAGFAAGCRTVFVDRSWDERGGTAKPDARVETPLDATRWILNDSKPIH
jgi:D-glycero-D-manno-heptose 1,7-bisphosphate phosphatase